jgi:hypothetical protein
MSRTHTHPCLACGTPVDCDGEQERNEDGFPEVICRTYHAGKALCLCEACREADARAD